MVMKKDTASTANARQRCWDVLDGSHAGTSGSSFEAVVYVTA